MSTQLTIDKLPSNHPDYSRSRRLATLFNLTIEDYEAILKYQGGVCAICGMPPKTTGIRLSVDHDHKTGLVRGLLCWNCNRRLGQLTLDQIIAMGEYISVPPAVTALGVERFGRKGRVTNKAKRRRKRTVKRVAKKRK